VTARTTRPPTREDGVIYKYVNDDADGERREIGELDEADE